MLYLSLCLRLCFTIYVYRYVCQSVGVYGCVFVVYFGLRSAIFVAPLVEVEAFDFFIFVVATVVTMVSRYASMYF